MRKSKNKEKTKETKTSIRKRKTTRTNDIKHYYSKHTWHLLQRKNALAWKEQPSKTLRLRARWRRWCPRTYLSSCRRCLASTAPPRRPEAAAAPCCYPRPLRPTATWRGCSRRNLHEQKTKQTNRYFF